MVVGRVGRGSWVVVVGRRQSTRSSVVGGRSSVVGGECIVGGRRLSVIDEVVGGRSSVVGRGSWVMHGSWVVDRGSWVVGRRSWWGLW